MTIPPFQFMRSILALIILPALSLIICLTLLLDLYWIRRSKIKAKKLLCTWGRMLCAIAGIRVRIEGQDNLDPSQTYIFVANHASQVDIWSIQGYFPHNFCWIAKQELFTLPVFGRIMRAMDFIPLSRSNGRKAVKNLNDAAARIKGGQSVLIFPEGSRSSTGRLQPFKTGAALLAIKAGVSVVPVGLNGTYQVLPKGNLMSRSGEVVLRIGCPFPTENFQTRDKQLLAKELHDQISALLEERYQPIVEKTKDIITHDNIPTAV